MFEQRLSILTYHRVLPQPDPLRPDEPDVAAFKVQISVLARFFRVLPLREAIARLQEGTLPARAVAITFDDGYADNYELALPLLLRFGLPATFFVATGFLGGGMMWNDAIIETVRRFRGARLPPYEGDAGEPMPLASPQDRHRAAMALINRWRYLPPDRRRETVARFVALAGGELELSSHLMMRPEQVRGLVGHGMEIGAHTVNHPILACLDDDAARREILDSKSALEAITGAPVRLFAYPNGRPQQDYGERHVKMVRAAGFTAAVSTRSSVATAGDNVYELPRFAPWRRSAIGFLASLARHRWRQRGSAAVLAEGGIGASARRR